MCTHVPKIQKQYQWLYIAKMFVCLFHIVLRQLPSKEMTYCKALLFFNVLYTVKKICMALILGKTRRRVVHLPNTESHFRDLPYPSAHHQGMNGHHVVWWDMVFEKFPG